MPAKAPQTPPDEPTPKNRVKPRSWQEKAQAALQAKAAGGDPKAIRLLLELGEWESHTTSQHAEVIGWYARALRRLTQGWEIPDRPGDEGDWQTLRARVRLLEEERAEQRAAVRDRHDLANRLAAQEQKLKDWQCPQCGRKPE